MRKITSFFTTIVFLFGGILSAEAQFIFPGDGDGASWETAYEVSTVTQLDYLRTSGNKDKYFKLVNDIDLIAETNWQPIGDNTMAFEGKFDGNGFKIKNLTINRPDEDYVGLFGRTAGAAGATELRKVIIENATVVGDSLVGALLGRASATIDSCQAINVNVTGRIGTGGLIGRLEANGKITASRVSGSVAGTVKTGGLLGESVSGQALSVSASVSSATVTGDSIVGGLAGYFEGKNNVNITNCAALGNVSGRKDVGGVIGFFYNNRTSSNTSITNCYASGDVTGTAASVAVGGIVGRLNRASSSVVSIFEGNFSKAEVSGYENVGGLVGWQHSNVRFRNNVLAAESVSGSVTCQSRLIGYQASPNNFIFTNFVYEDLEYTGTTPSAIANIQGTDTTLVVLQTEAFYTTSDNWDLTTLTFSWDFTDIWKMNTGDGKDGLPILKIAYVAPEIGTNLHREVLPNTSVWVSEGTILIRSVSEIHSVNIYNVNGRILNSLHVNGLSEINIPVVGFNRGIYIVKVSNSKGMESFKVIY